MGRCSTSESGIAKKIEEVVNQEIRKEISKDLELPEIIIPSMTLFPMKSEIKVTIVGIATVEVCGLTIKGVTVKQGQDGLFVTCPNITARKTGIGM